MVEAPTTDIKRSPEAGSGPMTSKHELKKFKAPKPTKHASVIAVGNEESAFTQTHSHAHSHSHLHSFDADD